MAEEGSAWVPVPVPLPPPGRVVPFHAGGLELLLCNADGTPYVIADRCPHARTSLADGRLRGTVLECPLHGGSLDVRDGSPVEAPIRRPATCFAVRPGDGGLQVALPAAVS